MAEGCGVGAGGGAAGGMGGGGSSSGGSGPGCPGTGSVGWGGFGTVPNDCMLEPFRCRRRLVCTGLHNGNVLTRCPFPHAATKALQSW